MLKMYRSWVGAIDDRQSTSGYYSFVGGNLVTWRIKKQKVVARSSAEAEFRGMALGIHEALWLRLLLTYLVYPTNASIQLYCYNKAARDIAHNSVQHNCTKHVEVDGFFIKEKLDGKILKLPKIHRRTNWLIFLLKQFSSKMFSKFESKLGMFDICVPT